jgi:hypothetical protein
MRRAAASSFSAASGGGAFLKRVEEGKLSPADVLTYEVVYDGDVARELVVKNYREEGRLREIVNSVKWTLDTISSSYR